MSLHWLPVTLAVVFSLAIIVPYSISVSLGHLQSFLPYISDAGVLLPERAFFGELINLGAFLQALVVYVRFEQVTTAKSYRSKRGLALLNRVGLWVGLSVSFGLTLIANFQLEIDGSIHKVKPLLTMASTEESNESLEIKSLTDFLPHANPDTSGAKYVQLIHWAGAFFAFVGGMIWMMIQAYLSQAFGSRRRFILRLTMASLTCVFTLVGIPTSLIADARLYEERQTSEGETSASLALQTFAVCMEWLVALLIIMYQLTFAGEFKHLRVTRSRVLSKRLPIQPHQQAKSSSSSVGDSSGNGGRSCHNRCDTTMEIGLADVEEEEEEELMPVGASPAVTSSS